MNTRTDTSKLTALRAKTDRQLLEMVNRTLEVARCFSSNEDYRARAARACDEVRRLLPLLAPVDRRRYAAQLEDLCESLHPTAHAACF
jgi:hypothetical protein